ncbi:MAG: DUF1566 domain-containing protein [bacterium]
MKKIIFAVIAFSAIMVVSCGGDDSSGKSGGGDTTNGKIGNLYWSLKASSSKTWEEAVAYCDNLEESGHSDWRLPTISELRTLIQNCPRTETGGECGVTDDCLEDSYWSDACRGCDYASDGRYSKLGDTGGFWSASEPSDVTHYAWSVSFYDGLVGNSYKGNCGGHVRCVR